MNAKINYKIDYMPIDPKLFSGGKNFGDLLLLSKSLNLNTGVTPSSFAIVADDYLKPKYYTATKWDTWKTEATGGRRIRFKCGNCSKKVTVKSHNPYSDEGRKGTSCHCPLCHQWNKIPDLEINDAAGWMASYMTSPFSNISIAPTGIIINNSHIPNSGPQCQFSGTSGVRAMVV